MTPIRGDLPDDVREKLEMALAWLGDRQPLLRECLQDLRVRLDDRVTVITPDTSGEGMVANPGALRDLEADAVAGALVSAVLAAPRLTGLPEDRYDAFRDAVEELWDGYLDEE